MNNIFNKIFPEAISNNILKFCVHPIAELYILEYQNNLIKDTTRSLNISEKRLLQMNIELERYTQAERDLQMFTEADEEFYLTERLLMELNPPSPQCIKEVEGKIEKLKNKIKECRNIREFYYTDYFFYRGL
jgi:hypothetical protein